MFCRRLEHWQAPVELPVVRRAIGATEYDLCIGGRQAQQELRPQHTVLELAQALGLKLDLRFPKGEEAGLAKAAVAAAGPVLIAWEHEDIPDIVNAIVDDKTTCPQKWDGARFDLVWVLDRKIAGDGWDFTQAPQLLLSGDSAKPIA